MTTFGTMETRIADELSRTDLNAQIQKAIKSAIRHYERRRFYFNERIDTFSLSSSQEWYSTADFASMDKIVTIDTVKYSSGGSTHTIAPRDFSYIDEISSGQSFGDPTDYAYYRQQMRFYPIPNQARSVTISYVYKPSELSASTDSNFWMTDAEELIRMRAKADVLVNVIREAEAYTEAAALRQREIEVLGDIAGELSEIAGAGRIRPSM
ncbi:hypothetical protein [Ferrovibrio sp.]|uniref:phage adaptor protein n=1 Tax=Ferrovibrio sp. TaxID=1917215 RepID=UPI0035AF70A6